MNLYEKGAQDACIAIGLAVKTAAEESAPFGYRLLGPSWTGMLTAGPGRRWEGYGVGYDEGNKEILPTLGWGAGGAGIGAALGAGIGALGRDPLGGAALGAALGGTGGSMYRGLKGYNAATDRAYTKGLALRALGEPTE